ncbi:MAG: GNAT family N-acetyltransferase [Chloroherpetonaceae bacterium]
MQWQCSSFAELSPKALYDILKARADVFVVEQQCAYLDLDGIDEHAHHLVLYGDFGDLVAYARLVPPHLKFQEPSIGRVLTVQAARGKGFGRRLMQESISRLTALYPNAPIRIGAQAYLETFYSAFGFVRVSDNYDDDGIPHLEMLRPAT